MSTFLVSTAHIDALINAAMSRRRSQGWERLKWYHNEERRTIDETNASDVGADLVRMNYAAVSYRYRRAGDWDGQPSYPETYRYTGGDHGHVYNPVVILKAIYCFEYQCSDHPNWAGSSQQAFCAALRMHVIEWLPGYDAAPGEITDARQAWEVRSTTA
jgi:hypothetical protein